MRRQSYIITYEQLKTFASSQTTIEIDEPDPDSIILLKVNDWFIFKGITHRFRPYDVFDRKVDPDFENPLPRCIWVLVEEEIKWQEKQDEIEQWICENGQIIFHEEKTYMESYIITYEQLKTFASSQTTIEIDEPDPDSIILLKVNDWFIFKGITHRFRPCDVFDRKVDPDFENLLPRCMWFLVEGEVKWQEKQDEIKQWICANGQIISHSD